MPEYIDHTFMNPKKKTHETLKLFYYILVFFYFLGVG